MFFNAAMTHTASSRSGQRGECGWAASFGLIMKGYAILAYLFIFILSSVLFAAVSGIISGVSVSVCMIILIILVRIVIMTMKYQ